MLRFSRLLIRKDFRLVFMRGNGFLQALLLGLLLIFVFSLSRGTGESTSPQDAAAIFWLATAFCLILVFSRLYALDEINGIRIGLLLSQAPAQAIWLGKCVTGLVACGLSQCLFIPSIFVFLGQSVGETIWPGIVGLALADLGMCVLGALLAGSGTTQSGAESLLSLIFFPLLVPLLLAGISLGGISLGGGQADQAMAWIFLAAAFDAIYAALGLLCFPFLYKGDS